MSFSLREGESVKVESNFHWSAFLMLGIWASFGAIIFLVLLLGQLFGKSSETSLFVPMFLIAVFFFLPILFKWLNNKNKKYLVTNQRIYIESGLLTKNQSEIPLQKVNEVMVNQGMLQRMFGAGNIVVMTGNNVPTILVGIEKPNEFKNAIATK